MQESRSKYDSDRKKGNEEDEDDVRRKEERRKRREKEKRRRERREDEREVNYQIPFENGYIKKCQIFFNDSRRGQNVRKFCRIKKSSLFNKMIVTFQLETVIWMSLNDFQDSDFDFEFHFR